MRGAKRPAVHYLSAGPNGYEAVDHDSDGFQPSAVLGCAYRLDAVRDAQGNWEFDLREKG